MKDSTDANQQLIII